MGGTGQVLTGQQEEVTAFLPSKLVRDWSEHFALPANLRRKEAGSGPGGPWYSWATTAETRCVLHPSLTRCSALSPRDCFPALPLWIPQCKAPQAEGQRDTEGSHWPLPLPQRRPKSGTKCGECRPPPCLSHSVKTSGENAAIEPWEPTTPLGAACLYGSSKYQSNLGVSFQCLCSPPTFWSNEVFFFFFLTFIMFIVKH